MSEQADAFGNYSPMPAEPPREPLAAGLAPSTVVNTVKLMLVRAGLSLIALAVLLGTKKSLKSQILKASPSFDPAKVDTAASVAITVGIVVGIIFIGLYVLLALQVRKGKSWARIVTLVLAGLSVLSGLVSQLQPAPGLSRSLGLVNLVLDIAIIALLTRRPSVEYFRRTP
jgi:hypothetical protein